MAVIPLLAMVRKDLQLFFADRRSVIISFVVPIAIASFFGSIFGGPSRNAIFDNLETLKGRGKALLYTTHYMEEVERLADRIVVMDHGKVIAEDTLDGLQSRVAGVGGGKATLESVFLTLTGRSLRD